MVKKRVSSGRRRYKRRAPTGGKAYKKAQVKAKRLKNAKAFVKFLKENPKDESDSEE